MDRVFGISLVLSLLATAFMPAGASDTEALAVGETFTVESKALNETRRINVYRPTYYGEAFPGPLPVLYMPDGGVNEDFLHIAGLVNIGALNGTMRPFLLVGIENTERRRDLTGPTEDLEDKKIAPRVGGSAAFRQFLRDELMPRIRARYEVTDEAAIVGESLAGLFVIETFFLEPDMFDTYIAVDPSLWWNRQALVKAADGLDAESRAGKRLFMAASSEPTILEPAEKLAAVLRENKAGFEWYFLPKPEETHATVYHPAALEAFRRLFTPPEKE